MLSKSSSSLQIQSFDVIPSAEEFTSQFESKSVPAVFRGCVKYWKAFSRWNPLDGGLDYLQETVGSSNVEAMLSHEAPVFYGDIRNHERVSLPCYTFIEYCKGVLQNGHCNEDNILEPTERPGAEQQAEQFDCPQQIYLAQVPLLSRDSAEKVQLESLREDIDVPSFLERKTLQSINLWMNSSQTRSSTHYDPHHNLLCIVSGCKQVVLWPPSATPFLYPLPIYGESSNHSAIPLEKPDFSLYPRSECSSEYSQEVILQAGDAIFIPEGWYHQVDSDRLTAAVNFWWQSDVISSLVEHMDSYYLRRILKRLIDKEMDWMLRLPPFPISLTEASGYGEQVNENGGKKSKPRIMLHELDPTTAQALHDIVALVHKHVNPSQSVDDLSGTQPPVGDKDDLNKRLEVSLFDLRDDRIAMILWTLRPHAVQFLFLAMAQQQLPFSSTISQELWRLWYYMHYHLWELKYLLENSRRWINSLVKTKGTSFTRTFMVFLMTNLLQCKYFWVAKSHLHGRHSRMFWISIWESKIICPILQLRSLMRTLNRNDDYRHSSTR